MALQPPGVLHRPHQWIYDGRVRVFWPIAENIENARRQLKDRNVVDLIAYLEPSVAQSVNTAAPRLAYRRDFVIDGGKAVLEGERVEQHQAPDTQGRRTILFLVGLGDDVGDSTRHPSVLGHLPGCLLYRVPHNSGSGGDTVGTLQFQRQGAQVVGEVGYRSTANVEVGQLLSARAVQPPTKVISSFESRLDVHSVAQTVRVEDANQCKRFGKGGEPFVELILQRPLRSRPFALQQNRVPGPQLGPNVGCAFHATAFLTGGHAEAA